MTPQELKQRYGALLEAHDAALNKLELEEQRLGGEQRRALRALLGEAGQETAIQAGLEDPYFDAFPPASALKEGDEHVGFDF
jgi:hypothetical protein